MEKKNLISKKKAVIVALAIAVSMVQSLSTMAQQVKNIVLVHGAFADGSGWEAVYNILKKKGYNVSIVGNPNTSLQNDVDATKLVLARQNGPVILVGHSYGGAIITEAGNESNVQGLVYVSAFAPGENESLLTLLQAGPPAPNAGIMPPENGYVWYDKAKYHAGFCADLSKEKADFMADSQIPVSASVFGAKIEHPAWKTKPSWFLIGTEDQTIPPDGQRYMAKRAGSKVTEVKSSHVVYISHPQAVADIIETAAENAGKKH
jgi:pimeloyl-ACP methyl ester carboxylesterase